ncbi:MAG: cytochrome C [Acidobacteria bacterium]|nr:MAG: cytochrome C [Acidobacteriota bacterium]
MILSPGSPPRSWLSPVVHLSNNWISLLGVVIVTTATVFWFFLLPTLLRGEAANPYAGILVYLMLPTVFIGGLILIPLGILWRRRRERASGTQPTGFLPLTFRNPELRRLVAFIGVTTVANVIIAGQFTYSAVNYMESVSFCGQTCHTVMQPEFTAYQSSPHSRVECVKCHIGPGAGWFVRSKLSGVGQVFAVAFNNYPRPIPTPVHNLRPARETCETCHWPQVFGGNRLKVISKYADDESNTASKTVLLLHIGGGNGTQGIHGMHVGPGIRIRYASADEKRQTIPWVEYRDAKGKATAYTATDAKGAMPGNLPIREMDCMDCHNRPSHAYEMPDPAVDRAMAAGAISPSLPFAKKTSVAILKTAYTTSADAESRIPVAFQTFYREKYSTIYATKQPEIEHSARSVLAIYQRNIFPAMNVTWGAYPNNVGHIDFPGCFRCHDDGHIADGGAKITQDCSACHNMLAMEEAAPKILTDLGLEK